MLIQRFLDFLCEKDIKLTIKQAADLRTQINAGFIPCFLAQYVNEFRMQAPEFVPSVLGRDTFLDSLVAEENRHYLENPNFLGFSEIEVAGYRSFCPVIKNGKDVMVVLDEEIFGIIPEHTKNKETYRIDHQFDGGYIFN